jgi:hypothetical protein
MKVGPHCDSFTRENDTKINSVQVDGDAQVYKPVTLKFNATNYSNTNNKPVVLWASYDGKKYSMCNATGMNIDKGKTGDFYLTFTPTIAGVWYIDLLTSDTDSYNPSKGLLSNTQNHVNVKGTSLIFEVSNIDEDKNAETVSLKDNSIEGHYTMHTTDKAPCTKTMYIILKEYDSEEEHFVFSHAPDNASNKKVVGEFKDNKPVSGNFSFKNLKKGIMYKLSVGVLDDDIVMVTYNDPTIYMYNGTTAVSSVKVAEGTDSNIYYDLSGRRIVGKPTQKGLYIHNGNKLIVK